MQENQELAFSDNKGGVSEKHRPVSRTRSDISASSNQGEPEHVSDGNQKKLVFDHRNPQKLRSYLTNGGKILPRRITGLNAQQQRRMAKAIKRAHNIGLLP